MLCNLSSTYLIIAGIIAGGVTMNPIVLGIIAGSGLILKHTVKWKTLKEKDQIMLMSFYYPWKDTYCIKILYVRSVIW